jgi:hypothetical protein
MLALQRAAANRAEAPDGMLALQRAAGNRAVARAVLARQRNVYPEFSDVPSGMASVVAEETQRLSQQIGIAIRADRVLDAPWIGRIHTASGQKSSVATSEGWLRSERKFWKAFAERWPEDYGLLGPRHTITPEFAERFGWPESVVGQSLVHHHVGNSSHVVAVPKDLHVAEIHARARVVTPETTIAPPVLPEEVGVGVPASATSEMVVPTAPALEALPSALVEAEELTPLTVGSVVRDAARSGALRGFVRGLVVGLAIGVAASLGISWAHRRILEKRLKALEPVIRRRLAAAVPAGIEMALRHPADSVYACIVTRVGHPSSISLDPHAHPGRGEGAPTAHPEHVRVFFDLEPHEGELGYGVSGGIVLFESWTEYGRSVSLDELLKTEWPTVYEGFVRSRGRALAAYYDEHPEARPLSAVSSVPHEDPVVSLHGRRPEK